MSFTKPYDDDKDFNPEIDQMIEKKLDEKRKREGGYIDVDGVFQPDFPEPATGDAS